MWQLSTIYARNLCSFRELEYSPLQGFTTLIFGNNLDNESQGSNGSGKSALIEAISIALTGESLRNVNIDEMINDSYEVCLIDCKLFNVSTGDKLVVERTFKRNATQEINVFLNQEKIVCPSILEYNRYILDTIGLNKSDIFSCFILSKHRYTSFLNASDRIKKELINRFSNGNLVDESIAHLKADTQQAREAVIEVEKKLAHCEGRISSLQYEIDLAQSKVSEKNQRRQEMIEAHLEAIANQRQKVRTNAQTIRECEERLEKLEALDKTFGDLEDRGGNINECWPKIIELIKQHSLCSRASKDYPKYAEELAHKLCDHEQKATEIQAKIKQNEVDLKNASTQYEQRLSAKETQEALNVPKTNKLQASIENANKRIKDLMVDNAAIMDECATLHKEIARLQGVLAGAIECPACKHKFVLQTDESVTSLNQRLTKATNSLRQNTKDGEKNDAELAAVRKSIETDKNEMARLDDIVDSLTEEVRVSLNQIKGIEQTIASLKSDLAIEQSQITRMQSQVQSLRKSMFDEAFDLLDIAIRQADNDIEQAEIALGAAANNITSYEEAIAGLKAMSIESDTADLKERLKACESELQAYVSMKEDAESKLTELIAQESRFVDFKTHLANTKIEALAQLTNEFLKKIGSDIRIAFSGYTILKSGKSREKISISLLRDGIDCGSFGKFSAGEQCRVNLASILALHKLTNMNCDDDKGLDLLILDEILDATDESGLANMFEALNSLQITSMVVSHGQIAEAYPYRLTITKQNSISTINEINT